MESTKASSNFSTPSIEYTHIKPRYKYEVTIHYSDDKRLKKETLEQLEEIILRFDKELRNVANQ